MADSVLAQHPPVVKVGGRRLSVSKPKPRTNGPTDPPAPAPAPESTFEDNDYPRPAPPHDINNDEGEPPKRERRQGHGNHGGGKKVRECVHRKTEPAKPTRDVIGGKIGFGGAGRLLQPGGKGFSV